MASVPAPTPASAARGYAVCRNDKGAYKVFRVRTRAKAMPEGWTLVETVGGWEAAQARLAALIADRERALTATTDRANRMIRAVLGTRIRHGTRFRVTEADIAAKGITGVLTDKRVPLSPGSRKYLEWLDRGRPGR